MPKIYSNKRIVSRDGKLSIPASVDLLPDDAVEFIVEDDGKIVIKKLE